MSPVVILLHGLGRTRRSMGRLGRTLEARGFRTWSMTYPSRRCSLGELASIVGDRIEADCGDQPLMAVTHSLGGIVLRHLSDRFAWGPCVMLAPPNAGSRAAQWGQRFWIGRRLFGPVLGDLARADHWPPPPPRTLVIAGTRGLAWSSPPSWLFFCSRIFDRGEAHDGTVALSETRHGGADAHVSRVAGHSTIMLNPGVIDASIEWLSGGAAAPAD